MQACKAADVSCSTFYRWMREDPAFLEALVNAQKETGAIVAAVIHQLAIIAPKAIDTLDEALTDPGTRTSEKVQAANVALTRLTKLRENVEFDERLTALEKELKP